METSPMLLTDGYKLDHRNQLPEEAILLYANNTPRKSRIPEIVEILACGPQYYIINTLIELWNEEFFKKPVEEVCAKFYRRVKNYTSKEDADRIGVEHVRALHKLGYLPLEIKALPEGLLVPIKTPVFTVKNTLPEYAWLTNYIETDMSAETWGMMTSATSAFNFRKLFERWAMKTVGNTDFVPFQGHDFSYRGMFGRQAAKMSGAAHLFSFVGTDTIPAIDLLEDYYEADSDKELVGCSVFATEHAVMCVGTGFYIKKNNITWERYGEAEFEVFKRLITEVYPNGFISIVSDTWNLWTVLTDYLPRLKNEIMARNGKVIIRPDSGDPVDILCGEPIAQLQAKRNLSKASAAALPESKGVIELLWSIFGGTSTDKGFKLLDSHIGAIYGDSITLDRAQQICERLYNKGFASINWVAGIGSYTYQYVTRDTFGFATKGTYAEVEIDGRIEGIEIFKDPITDDGTKKSLKGLLAVLRGLDGKIETKDQCSWEEEQWSLLETVFKNGLLIKKYTLSEIRAKVKSQIPGNVPRT